MFWANTSPLLEASTDFGEISPPMVSMSVRRCWSEGVGFLAAKDVVVALDTTACRGIEPAAAEATSLIPVTATLVVARRTVNDNRAKECIDAAILPGERDPFQLEACKLGVSLNLAQLTW